MPSHLIGKTAKTTDEQLMAFMSNKSRTVCPIMPYYIIVKADQRRNEQVIVFMPHMSCTLCPVRASPIFAYMVALGRYRQFLSVM